MSWWNPWSWNPDAVDRWELRISRFLRWIPVVITVGAAVGFLVWFGVSAAEDYRLSRHGVVVTATVRDVTPDGRDTEYLLSFVVDGQPETRWTTDLHGPRVGDRVAVIVDRGDHGNFQPTSAYGRRWGGYVIQVVASAVFAGLGIMFVRMSRLRIRWPRAATGRYPDRGAVRR